MFILSPRERSPSKYSKYDFNFGNIRNDLRKLYRARNLSGTRILFILCPIPTNSIFLQFFLKLQKDSQDIHSCPYLDQL